VRLDRRPCACAPVAYVRTSKAGTGIAALKDQSGTEQQGNPREFRSGYVAIVGKPNAGKSTLLNALVGEKIAITSDKPQTTRDKITGIFTTDRFQIVFLDTPGVLVPQDRFNEVLMSRAAEALEEVDVVYHMVDALDKEPANERLNELIRRISAKTPKFLVVNKIDRLRGPGRSGRPPLPPGLEPSNYEHIFLLSALRKKGLDVLIEETLKRMPVGPMYYDPEQLSDRDLRFLAAEAVREKVFRRTGAEIPYSVFTEVEEYTERADKDYIRVVIVVERDSQKGILIGKGGQVLKDIGQDARREIEKTTGRPCYLELFVKVRKDWRKKEFDLNNFGFKLPKAKPGRKK
jgi:GTP-binding protein Era